MPVLTKKQLITYFLELLNDESVYLLSSSVDLPGPAGFKTEFNIITGEFNINMSFSRSFTNVEEYTSILTRIFSSIDSNEWK